MLLPRREEINMHRKRTAHQHQPAGPLRHSIEKELAWYRKKQFYWNGFAQELSKIETFAGAVEFLEQ